MFFGTTGFLACLILARCVLKLLRVRTAHRRSYLALNLLTRVPLVPFGIGALKNYPTRAPITLPYTSPCGYAI